MRQRVQSRGFEGLEPHEIIEVLLFYAISRQDVNELAHRLLDRFGSVQGVLTAEIPDLESVPGVGAYTARWLALVGEAAAACATLSADDRPSLENYRRAYRFAERMEPQMIPPCCVQLCLDPRRRLLYRREICNSLSWGETATLREALADVFASRARSVILLIHTGKQEPMPKDYDIAHAADYAAALRAADCGLLDVIFVSGSVVNSMNRLGLIPGEEGNFIARVVREDYLRDAD